MTKILQVGNRMIAEAAIIPLLASFQMLPQLWREIIIDQAIDSIELTSVEKTTTIKQFDEEHQLTTQTELQAWLERYGMTLEQKDALSTRNLRIEKFKQITWESKLESYFIGHKSQLDRVIYSLIRTTDVEIAQELYFRLRAGEQSFAECAREYSQGPEAETGGMLGPVELGTPHPTLAKMLSTSLPGQLWSPTRLGEWLVIVRLEKLIPAQLDKPMRQQLLNKLFEGWLQEQIEQLGAVRLHDPATLKN